MPYYASGDPGLFKSLKRLKLRKIVKPLSKLTLGKALSTAVGFFPGIGQLGGGIVSKFTNPNCS